MTPNRLILIRQCFFLMFIISSFTLLSCNSETDEQVLVSSLDGLISAIENRERTDVRQYLSKDFLAQRKQGRAQAEQIMLFYFRQNQNISIYRLQQDVQINKDRAEVTLIVMITGSSGLLPERGNRYQVDMLWRKQAGAWLLSNVNWERSLSDG